MACYAFKFDIAFKQEYKVLRRGKYTPHRKRRKDMASYIILSTLTDEGIKTIKEKP